jgi:hypothetical protein
MFIVQRECTEQALIRMLVFSCIYLFLSIGMSLYILVRLAHEIADSRRCTDKAQLQEMAVEAVKAIRVISYEELIKPRNFPKNQIVHNCSSSNNNCDNNTSTTDDNNDNTKSHTMLAGGPAEREAVNGAITGPGNSDTASKEHDPSAQGEARSQQT